MAITATALNQALQALSACGGGIYTLPKGQYTIDQTIIIPEGVVLRGEFFTMPMGTRRFPISLPVQNIIPSQIYQVGTCFNVTTTAPAVKIVGDMAGIEGVTFYYPNQSETAVTYYSASILVDSPTQAYVMGAQIRNILFVNSYIGVEAGTGQSFIGQMSIEGLRGQPLYRGIIIDKCVDVTRIKDIHFWAFWSSIAYIEMCRIGAIALRLFYSDWIIVDDFFGYGYPIGIQFVENATGGLTNGLFSNIQCDASGIALDIYAISRASLMFSNCNFVSTLAPFANDPRFSHLMTLPIWVHNSTRSDAPFASLMLQNCSFWGDYTTGIVWEHPGKLFISSSHMKPATQNFFITNGNVRATGCHFETANVANARLQVV